MRQVTRRRGTYLYIGGYLLYSKATDLNVTHKFSSAATHTLVSDHQPGYVESVSTAWETVPSVEFLHSALTRRVIHEIPLCSPFLK